MRSYLRASALSVALASCILASASAQDHPAEGLSIPQSSLTPAEHARAIALAEPQAAISTPNALHPDAAHARNSPHKAADSIGRAPARRLAGRRRG
jgi:hypothetical protein